VDWLLILLACLVPLDVGVRRVQLDWAVICGWFRRKSKAESTETLGALLRLKEKVRETTAGRPTATVTSSPVAPRPSPQQTTPAKPAVTVTEPAPDPESPDSTTERLLAMKRKRQQGGKNDDTKP